MEQLMVYAGVVLVLFVIGFGGVFLKRRFDLKSEEMEFIRLVLDTVNYITKQFEFKLKDDVTKIVQYSFEALAFVEKYEQAEEDIEIKKVLVLEKAIEICEREGVDLDDGAVIELVERIVSYILSRV